MAAINIKNNFKRVIEFLDSKNPDIAGAIETHYLDFIRENMMLVKSGQMFGSLLTNNAIMMLTDHRPEEEVYTFSIFTVTLDGAGVDILDSTVINVDRCCISYNAQLQPTKH